MVPLSTRVNLKVRLTVSAEHGIKALCIDRLIFAHLCATMRDGHPQQSPSGFRSPGRSPSPSHRLDSPRPTEGRGSSPIGSQLAGRVDVVARLPACGHAGTGPTQASWTQAQASPTQAGAVAPPARAGSRGSRLLDRSVDDATGRPVDLAAFPRSL